MNAQVEGLISGGRFFITLIAGKEESMGPDAGRCIDEVRGLV